MATIGNLIVNLTARTASFEEGLAKAEKTLARTGRRFTALGKEITYGLSLPFAGAALSAVKFATQFDESLDKIVAIIGVSREQVDAWRGDLLTLASQTGRGPKELADALYFVAQSGLRGADALEALKASAMASAAGMGDIKIVADALTSALNAYGPANLSAATAAGVLVATVRNGKMQLDELAPVIWKLLPVSAQLGVSFGEVSGAVAAMSRLGMGARQTVAALRGVFLTLLKPTQQMRDGLALVGLSAEGLRAELRERGLLAVLQTLKAHFGENEIALARVFPEAEGFIGLLNLIGKNGEVARAVIADVAKATGQDLKNAFNIADKDASQQFAKALATLQVALIQLGGIALPAVVKLTQMLTSAAQKAAAFIGGLDAGTRNWLITVAMIIAALGPAIWGLGLFVSAVSGLAPVLGWIVAAAKLVASALGALAGPVGLIAVALIAVGLIIIDKWSSIVRTWDSLMQTFREVCRGYMDDVLIIADFFVRFFSDKFQALKDYFKNWVRDFMTVAEYLRLNGAVAAIRRFVDDTAEALGNSQISQSLKGVANDVKKWGSIIGETALNTGKDIAESVANGYSKAQDFVGGKLAAVKSVFSGGVAAPTLNMPAAPQIPNIAPDAAQDASAFSVAWTSALRETAAAGINWKTEMLGMMSSFEGSFAGGFWKALDTARGVFGAIKNLADNLFQSILKAFEELIAKLAAKMALYGILNLFTGGAFGGLTGGLGKFLGFAEGGLVPGMKGQPVPAIVHGGEYVLSLREMAAMGSVSTGAVAMAGGGTMSVSVNAPITINGGMGSQTDVRAVCEQITTAIKQGVSWGVENAKAAYKIGAKHDGEAM
ncbi:MAG: phage tail tape measure protein [Elusimicrobiales bacterium]